MVCSYYSSASFLQSSNKVSSASVFLVRDSEHLGHLFIWLPIDSFDAFQIGVNSSGIFFRCQFCIGDSLQLWSKSVWILGPLSNIPLVCKFEVCVQPLLILCDEMCGSQRHSIKDRIYPAVTPSNGHKVFGKVVFQLWSVKASVHCLVQSGVSCPKLRCGEDG